MAVLQSFLYKISLVLVLAILCSSCTKLIKAETNGDQIAKGQWRDPATNLIWMRCSMGQEWLDNTCQGKAKAYSWIEAQQATKLLRGGWRVPTAKELMSLVYCNTGFKGEELIIARNGSTTTISNICNMNAKKPTINNVIFPNTLESWYWSISPYSYSNSYVYIVNFEYGNININLKNYTY